MSEFDDNQFTPAFLRFTRSHLIRAEIRAWVERGFTGKVRGVFAQNRSAPLNYRRVILDAMRIYQKKPVEGNDAPRGGQCGWFAEADGEDMSWWVRQIEGD